ncbi:general secretion pathway protein N [Thalassolituus maritimus]|uniref:Type II secretion system protein N n=1 Tax=Thalassolituus maritimus TaxID=484498 RepID=A0A1N7MEX2_9GAMM|nr:type II secretion system protein N [Thalassolituus maritimus]SIS84666.1 general secretion pathway protein N [Thalassolituus maritimus]
MLRAVWSAKWYILLGLLAFILIVVATTPIHFLWKYAEPYARDLPVRIQNPTGTLWQGRADIGVPQAGTIAAGWELSPLSLLLGNADLAINAEGENIRLTGAAQATGLYAGLPERVIIEDLNGYLDSSALAPLLMQARANLDGSFELSRLNADISIADQGINDISGQLVYSGGQLRARVERQAIDTELPMLVANIVMDGPKVTVPVATADGEPLGQLFLQEDGWGGMTVLRRAVDIAGQSWPDKQADADTVIFEVSQKFL